MTQLTIQQKRAIRAYVIDNGERKYISIGKSWNTAGATWSTRIVVIDGDSPPTLRGHPYLKTHFRNGRRFEKTLYTPSTLRIEVGREWIAKHAAA